MSGTDRQRRAEAERWLVVAREDIRIAEACLGLSEPSFTGAAYHVQQAAEKAIKGILIRTGIAFRRTHDLEELGALTAPHFPSWVPLLSRLGPMTVWNAAYRYPSIDEFAETPPSLTDLFSAMDDIRQILAALEAMTVVDNRG